MLIYLTGFGISFPFSSVPKSLVCFFESNYFESAIRLAISLGVDSDTLVCVTVGIASVFYKDIPNENISFCKEEIPY